MEQKSRQEASGLLSGVSRATGGPDHQEKRRRQDDASASSPRSSGAYSRDGEDDDNDWEAEPHDFDSRSSPSSSAYSSYRLRSFLTRLFYSAGGSTRRRAVLGLASLILVSLVFWGFGVHTMLLKEKEKFLSSAHPGAGTAATPTEVPSSLWDVGSDELAPSTTTTTGSASEAPASSHNSADAGDDDDNNSGKPDHESGKVTDDPNRARPSFVPAVTLDEHSHNRKPSNESEYCTTWPVDDLGRYEAKTIPAAQRHKLKSYAPAGGWKKPAGLKVVAMVFYGRKRNVDILDCYLRENLASNGGYLDEVRFMVKTTNEDDIEWLRSFAKGVEGYTYQDLDLCTTQHGYGCIWEYADEDDTMYIKIDDDILYIHQDAIPQLVHTRLAVTQPYAVSAQLVNSPVSGLQQYHYGAIHPFIPDPYSHPVHHVGEEWRPSAWGVLAKGMKAATEGAKMDAESPYDGHPWVLMTSSLEDMSSLLKTPMGDWQTHLADDPAFGPGWKSWAIAAQQEYSLLYNIELDEMDRYHFGRPIRYKTGPAFPIATMAPSATSKQSATPQDHQQRAASSSSSGSPSTTSTIKNTHPEVGGENLFDMQYARYNLNFVAVWGRDVKLGLPIGDDEADFTQYIPRRLGRPFVIDTRAIVAHNSFFTQHGGIRHTDLLDRWRALANEMSCKPGNLKVPWDFRCKGF